MQVSIQNVTEWAALASLARIPLVGCQYCELLLQIGVYSVVQLAHTNLN
jgi:hypothetical protein